MMDVKAIANLRPSRQWLRLSEESNRLENLQPYTHGQHISLEKKGKPNPSSKLHGFAKGCTPWNKGKKDYR
jgi:hypothetical protein